MLTYLLRRLLLIVPTLIGMAAIVFAVVSMAPGGIEATVMSRDAQIKPEERRAIQKYLNKRYGLDRPRYVQFGRWLNKFSPIGFATYADDDPRVVEADKKEAELEAPLDAQDKVLADEQLTLNLTTKAGLAKSDEIEQKRKAIAQQKRDIRISPDAGDAIFTRPRIKLPDFGDSFVRRTPVIDLIVERLPVTLSLQVIALPISYTLAVWLGIQQARRRGKPFDVVASGFTLALWCVPLIWVTLLSIGFFASEQYPNLRWFPATGLNDLNESAMRFLPSWQEGVFQKGWLLDRAYHMLLPLLCLTYANFAFLSRLARGALLDNLNSDFVRTARAKGLPPGAVLYRHAFRTSLIPLITVLVNILPGLVVGSVVVERAFGIQGMGSLAVEAAMQKDFELLLSLTTLVGLLQLVAYLVADIGYALADPRVSFD